MYIYILHSYIYIIIQYTPAPNFVGWVWCSWIVAHLKRHRLNPCLGPLVIRGFADGCSQLALVLVVLLLCPHCPLSAHSAILEVSESRNWATASNIKLMQETDRKLSDAVSISPFLLLQVPLSEKCNTGDAGIPHSARSQSKHPVQGGGVCRPQENQTLRCFNTWMSKVLVDLQILRTQSTQSFGEDSLSQTASATKLFVPCYWSFDAWWLDSMKRPPAVEDGFPWPVMPCPLENCAAQIWKLFGFIRLWSRS